MGPASMPVQPVATLPLAPRWGLAPEIRPSAAEDQDDIAEGTWIFSSGSASAPEPASLCRLAETAGPFAPDLSPREDQAPGTDPARGARNASGSPDGASELAFGVLLHLSGPPAPYSGAAAAENEYSQAKNSEAFGAAQSQSQTQAIPQNPRDFSAAAAGNAVGSIVGFAARNAASSNEHPPDVCGDNSAAGPADLQNVWNAGAAATEGPGAQPNAPAQTASPARTAAVEPPEPAATPVARDVSLHLADGEGRVDIRMASRAGDIQVTVHTPDGDLASSLRAGLPDLVGKLRQSGFQAEVWRPAAGAQSEGGRRSGSDAPPSQEDSAGSRKDGRQRQPQQERTKDQFRWAGEWRSSLDPAQESHI